MIIIENKKLILPKLEANDYLTKGANFWKNYRIILTKILEEQEQQEELEKTPENIVKLASEVGVKECTRYFNIQPSQVRYFRNKLNKKMINL